jgi:hypothetical protein
MFGKAKGRAQEKQEELPPAPQLQDSTSVRLLFSLYRRTETRSTLRARCMPNVGIDDRERLPLRL